MIKKMAWQAFKNTGDINTYLELKQIEEVEKGIQEQNINLLQEELKNDINKYNQEKLK